MKYDYTRLPAELQGLGNNYGLYRKKGQAPISAAEFLIGNRVFLKVNDPATMSSFEDAVRAYLLDTSGEVQGILCVLREEHKLLVVDLDKPKDEADFNRRKIANLTYAQYCELHKADVLDMAREYSQGTFVERSRSGEGFHLFFAGGLPSSFGGYNGKFVLGDVFSKDQAIFLTADFPIGAVTRLAGQRGVDKIIDDIKDSLQIYDGKTALIGTAEAKTESYGRALNLTDEQVLERYFQRNKEHREIYEGTRDLYGTGGTNWSEGTDLLQKEVDKITGDPDQIYRVMFNSPRLRNAGKAGNGVDRAKRTDKYFDKRLAGARRKNDQWFDANGGNPYANRQASIAHGADMFGRMGGGLAVSAPAATPAPPAPPVATMSRDDRLVAAGATERFNDEGEAYWTIGEDDNRKYIGKTAADLDAWLIANAPLPEAPIPLPEIGKATRFTGKTIKAIQKIMGTLPPEYLKFQEPPGLLGEACRMAAKGMYEPLPYLVVPATITAMAGIMSQAYKYHSTGLNVMFVLGAKTGVGKTQAAEVWQAFIDEILQSATGQDELLHRAKNRISNFAVGSRVGAHTKLQEMSAFAWFNDECEPILAMLEGTQPRDVAVQNIVLKMFEISKDSTRLEPEESRTGKHLQDRVLRNVSISSFWATTITTLRQYLQPEFLSKGFGSRLLFLLYRGTSGMEQNPRNMLRKLPEGDLRRTLKTLLRTAQEVENLYQALPAWFTELEPAQRKEHNIPEQASNWQALINVEEDEAASAFMEEMRANVGVFKRHVQADDIEFPEYYSMLSRVAMIAPRIAAIMAVLENPTKPVITLPQAYYSYGYCLQIMGETLSAFDTNELGVALNHGDITTKHTIIELVQKHPDFAMNGVPSFMLTRVLKMRAPFSRKECRDTPEQAIARLQGHGMVDMAISTDTRRGPKAKFVKVVDHPEWDELFGRK